MCYVWAQSEYQKSCYMEQLKKGDMKDQGKMDTRCSGRLEKYAHYLLGCSAKKVLVSIHWYGNGCNALIKTMKMCIIWTIVGNRLPLLNVYFVSPAQEEIRENRWFIVVPLSLQTKFTSSCNFCLRNYYMKNCVHLWVLKMFMKQYKIKWQGSVLVFLTRRQWGMRHGCCMQLLN